MRGASYGAFCEAVKRSSYPTKCFAVDHWKGDDHAGSYSDEIYNDILLFNSHNYISFSTLIRSSFDDALNLFTNGTIDILHIDGFHTYEAVKHDFETWLPKLSTRAIVLLHDVYERRPGFGVYRYWEELVSRFPSLTFEHGHGLGVVGIGKEISREVSFIFDLHQPGELTAVRNGFWKLGQVMESDPKKWAADQRKRTYICVTDDYSLSQEVVVRIAKNSEGPDPYRFTVFFDDPDARFHYSSFNTFNWRDAFSFADSISKGGRMQVVVQIADQSGWKAEWGVLAGYDDAS